MRCSHPSLLREEWREVEAVAEWASLNVSRWPELETLQVDISGARLSPAAHAVLKRMGRKPGWPDLHLPASRFGYHALFIEVKRRDGGAGLSEAQVKIHRHLRHQDNLVRVCLGSDEAISTLDNYLNWSLLPGVKKGWYK
jgi:hypothetical protein